MSFGAGCSFIDDFDFEVADGGVVQDGSFDGAVPSDGDVVPDGDTPIDMGGVTQPCVDPCLGDALAEFTNAQGGGALEWRYLADTRAPDGLSYGELVSGTHYGAPAWTDTTPPPALVACGDSTEGACADAGGGLLFEANAPGDGSDPVLSFVAPADGTYAVVADLSPIAGTPLVRLSRIARHDDVIATLFDGPGSLSPTIDLFAGERALVTVAPGADPGGAASIAGTLRVSRVVGVEPMADCQMALRFDPDDPLAVDCTSFSLSEDGTEESSPSSAPSDEYGQGRLMGVNAALRAAGLRFDYSGDFTVQMWIRVDALTYYSTAAYADWSAFNPVTAGGVSFGLDPRNGADTLDDVISAGYLFPLPAAGDPGQPSIECDADSCSGAIEVPIPSFGDWHFYRLVRDSAADQMRFCVDGELAGTGYLDGETDISNPADPTIGTYGFGQPTFQGAVDDIRVYRGMLPCGD